MKLTSLELWMTSTKIGDPGLRGLVFSINDMKVTSLDFNMTLTKIGDEGFRELASSIKHMNCPALHVGYHSWDPARC